MSFRSDRNPVRIGKVIESVLREAGEKNPHPPEALAVVSWWPEVVGNKLSRVCRAVSLKDGKLIVEVKSPVWKQELLFQKRSIIRKINLRMGNNIVSEVVFLVKDYGDD
jgi:predicted nucleic acid-binding Zn ribbon protein